NLRDIPADRRRALLDHPDVVYVGRPMRGLGITSREQAPFGNYASLDLPKDAPRLEQVKAYAEALAQDPALRERVRTELRGKLLADWCSPEPCHAHILAHVANNLGRVKSVQPRVVPTEPTWVSTFSNFRRRPLTYEGETYPTVEHLYQALKFKDPGVRAQIREEQDTKAAQTLAHRLLKTKPEAVVEGYTQNSEMSLDLMRRVLRIRAEQDEVFRKALLRSEGPIAEPRQDPFWGRGGENWMGRLLEELREELKHSLSEGVTREVPATSRPAGVPGDHPLVEPELGPSRAQALARSLLAAGEGSGTRATLRELAAARFADEYLRLARRALEPLRIRVGKRAELSEASTYYHPVVETARERVDQGLSFDRPLLESDPLWAEEPRLP